MDFKIRVMVSVCVLYLSLEWIEAPTGKWVQKECGIVHSNLQTLHFQEVSEGCQLVSNCYGTTTFQSKSVKHFQIFFFYYYSHPSLDETELNMWPYVFEYKAFTESKNRNLSRWTWIVAYRANWVWYVLYLEVNVWNAETSYLYCSSCSLHFIFMNWIM